MRFRSERCIDDVLFQAAKPQHRNTTARDCNLVNCRRTWSKEYLDLELGSHETWMINWRTQFAACDGRCFKDQNCSNASPLGNRTEHLPPVGIYFYFNGGKYMLPTEV